MTTIAVTTEAARAGLGALLDPYPRDAWCSVWARAVWSVLTEPGDGVAGELIAAHGAARALEIGISPASAPPAADGSEISAEVLRQARARWSPRIGAVAAATEVARRAGIGLITPESEYWPGRVDDLGVHAPVALWVQGSPTLLSPPAAAAIVGCRAASSYGVFVAAELADGCAGSGITVVSGAAYGIDGAAHEATLRTGGPTIAVLAGGVDRPYPSGHRALIDRIAAAGAVVAETPCGTAPSKWRFLARNRIIAALADATVVAEAAWRSGAINTAHHTVELDRPLGAVPGPITSATSAGCHRLLRELGAECITSAEDLRELIGWGSTAAPDAGSFTGERTRILDALSRRAVRDTLEVARRSGFSPEEAGALLGFLELDGLVERAGHGWRRPN